MMGSIVHIGNVDRNHRLLLRLPDVLYSGLRGNSQTIEAISAGA
jgi:hypothetical protein